MTASSFSVYCEVNAILDEAECSVKRSRLTMGDDCNIFRFPTISSDLEPLGKDFAMTCLRDESVASATQRTWIRCVAENRTGPALKIIACHVMRLVHVSRHLNRPPIAIPYSPIHLRCLSILGTLDDFTLAQVLDCPKHYCIDMSSLQSC